MILLVGGTGNLGGRIARHLAAHNLPFRALVRPTTDSGELQELAAEIVRGDLRESDGLKPALDGIETVISSAHSLDRTMSGRANGSIRSVDREGYRNLVTLASAAGVQRFVVVSFPGAILASHTPFAEAKLSTERLLRDSTMREVIVRPDAYQEIWLSAARGFDWPSGSVTIFGSGEGRASYVGMDDVAEAIVRLALHPDPPRTVDLGGPESMSGNEIVTAFERALGRPLRQRRVPGPVMRLASVVLRPFHPALASVMGMGVASDLRNATPDDRALRDLGIDARSVSTYIEQQAAAQRA